jgi:hypothetical protein
MYHPEEKNHDQQRADHRYAEVIRVRKEKCQEREQKNDGGDELPSVTFVTRCHSLQYT